MMLALVLVMNVVVLILSLVMLLQTKPQTKSPAPARTMPPPAAVLHAPLYVATVLVDICGGLTEMRSWTVPTANEEEAREIVTKQLQYLADRRDLVGPYGQVCEEFRVVSVTLERLIEKNGTYAYTLLPGWKS